MPYFPYPLRIRRFGDKLRAQARSRSTFRACFDPEHLFGDVRLLFGSLWRVGVNIFAGEDTGGAGGSASVGASACAGENTCPLNFHTFGIRFIGAPSDEELSSASSGN
jgi:hypothetical protein